MHLLAFDTSTDALSIAVQRGEAVWEHSGPGGAQASATLIAAIFGLLEQAALDLAQLDALVFGRGPGSFTGLRTACAVAQGLAFGANAGRGIAVLPIDTLAAVAEQARHQHGCTEVVAVLDARMDEVYAARYQWQASAWHSVGELGLCAPQDVQVPIGWTVAGNAQVPYGERLAPDARHVHALPTGVALLRLAPPLLATGHAVPATAAQPLYIRDKVAQTTAERAAVRAATGR
jgi:tRNA threonylcarbamoyladenosine biosynthesis protein TsaB